MSEQGQLLEAPKPVWIMKVWAGCAPDVRPGCIAILAEMGRAALARNSGGRGKPCGDAGGKGRDRTASKGGSR